MSRNRELIVGKKPFGITEDSVIKTIAEVDEMIQANKAILNDPDLGEDAKRIVTTHRRVHRALTETPPQELLEHVRGIHAAVWRFESLGQGGREIGSQILALFPETSLLSPLLKKTPWGKRLCDLVFSEQNRRKRQAQM